MITEVILPQLGETMNEGTIVQWLVKEGDTVNKGDVLFQLESDKAVLDAEAPAKGTVLKILHPKGSKVPVLTVVALIGEPGDDITPYLSRLGVAAPEAAAPAAPSPALPETKPAEEAGRIFASPRARRVAREKGIDLRTIKGSGPDGRIVEADVLAAAELGPRATPLARKVAEEAGVPLAGVAGTGPGGRVVRADVEQMVRPAAPAPAVQAPPAAAPTAVARQTVPLAGVRARIAERMSRSAQETARVTLTTEVDATRLVEARTQLKEALGDTLGFAIGYNDLLIAICARALREHPNVNCRLEGDQIRLLDEVHIGLAVDTDRGLLVPVVRNADRLRVVEIAQRLRELVARAREGKSGPDELTGGTFTITNLGMYGVDAFTPIINLPECAILGVGRIRPEPAVFGGQIAIRQRLWLSLTFDHRLVDGAPAARFLQRIAALVEEPYLLLA
jgi:pyruvate dehydrogenase E2 component (dihydrolipoamide acetyltransferase)